MSPEAQANQRVGKAEVTDPALVSYQKATRAWIEGKSTEFESESTNALDLNREAYSRARLEGSFVDMTIPAMRILRLVSLNNDREKLEGEIVDIARDFGTNIEPRFVRLVDEVTVVVKANFPIPSEESAKVDLVKPFLERPQVIELISSGVNPDAE